MDKNLYLRVIDLQNQLNNHSATTRWGSPCDIVANVLDYEIVVREFEPYLRYQIYFRTNSLKNVMNTLICPTMG